MMTHEDLMQMITQYSKSLDTSNEIESTLFGLKIASTLFDLIDKANKLELLDKLLTTDEVEIKRLNLEAKDTTAREYIESSYPSMFDDYDSEELERMKETNVIMHLGFYEKPPSFATIKEFFGASVESVMDKWINQK